MSAQLALLVPLLAASMAAQPEPRLKVAQAEARRCVEANVSGKLDTVADLTHPKLVAIVGGRQKLIDKLHQARRALEKDGVTYLSGDALVPDTLYKARSGQYCVVPVTYRVKIGDTRFLLKSPMIGVSTDDGKTWKFVDSSSGEANVRKLVPEIPRDLKFPPDEEPEALPDGP